MPDQHQPGDDGKQRKSGIELHGAAAGLQEHPPAQWNLKRRQQIVDDLACEGSTIDTRTNLIAYLSKVHAPARTLQAGDIYK